jgi:hypothetical protein
MDGEMLVNTNSCLPAVRLTLALRCVCAPSRKTVIFSILLSMFFFVCADAPMQKTMPVIINTFLILGGFGERMQIVKNLHKKIPTYHPGLFFCLERNK